ncbi:MAG: Hsp70 family protein [Gemmataceae bacterium]
MECHASQGTDVASARTAGCDPDRARVVRRGAARDLTVEAARAAGYEHVTLLEEPQAAFYAWLDGQGDQWREQVQPGDLILVSDVGGGTSDFTLIEVGSDAGNLALTRLAVGDHLLLGGDNMDLALAHTVAAALAKNGTKLDAEQMQQLTYASRSARKKLFADATLASSPSACSARSVGDWRQHQYDLTRARSRNRAGEWLLQCARDAEPAAARSAGVQELGLRRAADAGITNAWPSF